MTLTAAERLILWNQYELMKLLPGNREEEISECQTILERGYSQHYGRLFQDIKDEEEISSFDMGFVCDTLEMYEALAILRGGIDLPNPPKSMFPGFSGHTEAYLSAYVEFLVKKQGKWTHLNIKNYDSHREMVPSYRRMLAYWKTIPESRKFELTKDEGAQLLMLQG